MSSSIKTLHIIAKGGVQGVGLRASSKHRADALSLKGSVKNLSDGTVEIYVQGEETLLKLFIEKIKHDKGSARIEHLFVDEYPSPKIYQAFEIIF